jgi:hypothetical protein
VHDLCNSRSINILHFAGHQPDDILVDLHVKEVDTKSINFEAIMGNYNKLQNTVS